MSIERLSPDIFINNLSPYLNAQTLSSLFRSRSSLSLSALSCLIKSMDSTETSFQRFLAAFRHRPEVLRMVKSLTIELPTALAFRGFEMENRHNRKAFIDVMIEMLMAVGPTLMELDIRMDIDDGGRFFDAFLNSCANTPCLSVYFDDKVPAFTLMDRIGVDQMKKLAVERFLGREGWQGVKKSNLWRQKRMETLKLGLVNDEGFVPEVLETIGTLESLKELSLTIDARGRDSKPYTMMLSHSHQIRTLTLSALTPPKGDAPVSIGISLSDFIRSSRWNGLQTFTLHMQEMPLPVATSLFEHLLSPNLSLKSISIKADSFIMTNRDEFLNLFTTLPSTPHLHHFDFGFDPIFNPEERFTETELVAIGRYLARCPSLRTVKIFSNLRIDLFDPRSEIIDYFNSILSIPMLQSFSLFGEQESGWGYRENTTLSALLTGCLEMALKNGHGKFLEECSRLLLVCDDGLSSRLDGISRMMPMLRRLKKLKLLFSGTLDMAVNDLANFFSQNSHVKLTFIGTFPYPEGKDDSKPRFYKSLQRLFISLPTLEMIDVDFSSGRLREEKLLFLEEMDQLERVYRRKMVVRFRYFDVEKGGVGVGFERMWRLRRHFPDGWWKMDVQSRRFLLFGNSGFEDEGSDNWE
ncbi:hypothetical protein HDU67_009164 [Dinochytrium kinnereticum]|nr:hypothetical protein HDU67_009164 [Dinochytrium kinnereticum]